MHVQFPAGHSTAIVGRSGAGKSTIARLLTRVLEPDSGMVSLGSTDIRALDRDDYRRSIAVVPQVGVLGFAIAKGLCVHE